MTRHTLTTLTISGLMLGLAACDNTPHFTVVGSLTGADDKMLYLEAAGIDRTTSIDSVKLDESGTFKLKGGQPQTPEFYRLRVDNKIINLAIDSTEIISVTADYSDMPVNYTVEGSDESGKLKELALMQINLQSDIDRLARKSGLPIGTLQDSIARMVTHYKERVKNNYIYRSPHTLHAYFALFQRINGRLIFDPLTNREDVRCVAAVATGFENLYPHSIRTKNLTNLALKGLRNTRAPRQKTLHIDQDKISEAGLIDIALKDQNGKMRKLTDLKGKVVLLDFTVYANSASPARNMALRELYDKYKGKGLEIYQISLDGDEHYWKTSADRFPWVCVHEPAGAQSTYVKLYNIRDLPTYFLISRDNELKLRSEAIKDLETEVKRLL